MHHKPNEGAAANDYANISKNFCPAYFDYLRSGVLWDGGGLRGKLRQLPDLASDRVNEFHAYHRALGPLIIGYMVIPMLIATILTILLLWFRPASIPRWMVWLAIVLQLVVWVSTVTIQLPIQGQLSADGLSLPLIDRLRVTSFWFRRVPHIANAFLFLWMMSVLLRGNVRRSAEA